MTLLNARGTLVLRLPAPATSRTHGHNYFGDFAVILAVVLSFQNVLVIWTDLAAIFFVIWLRRPVPESQPNHNKITAKSQPSHRGQGSRPDPSSGL